jgi:DNA-binding HxlR family transcriptional regulator
MALLDLLGRRWALRIIWELRDGPAPSFRDLQRRCGGVSSSVLAERLRELGDAGVVERTPAGYGLTARGGDLLERLRPLEEWSAAWRPGVLEGASPGTGAPVTVACAGHSRQTSGPSRD